MGTDGVQNTSIGGYQFDTKSKADQKNGQTKDSTSAQVSIFSAYDSNKDSRVNFKEANSFKLFGQASINPDSAGLLKPNESDNGAGNRAIKMALDKFGDLRSNFENLLKGFNKGYTLAKADSSDSIAQTNERNNIDQAISTEAKTKGEKANEQLQTKYNSLLKEAYKQALQEVNAGKDLKDAPTTDEYGNITAGDADAVDVSNNEVEIKDYTQTAYSHYDSDTDGTILFNEAVKSEFDVSQYTKTTENTEVRDAMERDLKAIAQIETSKAIKTGVAQDVTAKTAKDLKKALTKASKELDTSVEQATTRRLQQIDNLMKAQVGRIADEKFDGNLNGMQKPITTKYDDQTITIFNGKASYGNNPAKFTPNNDGGGGRLTTTITENNEQIEITLDISSNGSVALVSKIPVEDKKELTSMGAVIDTDFKGEAQDVPEEYEPERTDKEGYNSAGEDLAAQLLSKTLDTLFTKLFDTEGNTTDYNSKDVSDDDKKSDTFDENKFALYKKRGVSPAIARFMADSANGVTPAAYDNTGKITKVKVTNANAQTITMNVKDLEEYINKLKPKNNS